jgi:transposase
VINSYDNFTKEDLITENLSLKSNLNLLQTELAQLKRMIFGSKSERFTPIIEGQEQLLFTDIETAQIEVKQENIAYTRSKATVKDTSTGSVTKHQGRLPLPKHLPRVECVLEPTENTEGLVCIGKEITEELEYTPGKFFVNQYIRPKYVRANNEGIIIAELPTRPIDKGIAGPGLLASILIEKYCDHLPLHRQLQRFKRENIHIPPSTIGDWVKHSAELLEPLYNTLKKQVQSSGYIMADETPIKVLDKDHDNGIRQGYYWVYRDVEKKLIVFDYQDTRGSSAPVNMLKNSKGFLQTDGYGVYDKYDKQDGLTLIHCMAHARRYFEKALDNDKARSEYVLQKMQLLYVVERRAREQNYNLTQRLQERQNHSLPILQELQQWLKDNITQVTPQSTIGKAIAYALTRWDKLCIYAHNGQLEIDNNPVENAIRPVALGRKNYLFAGSHQAAQRAAIIYSLIATCKANNIEPYAWLKNTLAIINDCKANKLYQLLPNP